MNAKILIIMSLLVLLSRSSFFLSPYLERAITRGEYSPKQLQFAIDTNSIIALKLAAKSEHISSENGLSTFKRLGKTEGEYAYIVAEYYLTRSGHSNKKIASTQLEKADYSQAVLWFKQAIRLQYMPASLALARLYYRTADLSLAEQVLSASKFLIRKEITSNIMSNKSETEIGGGSSEQAALNLAILHLQLEIAISKGDNTFIQKHFNKLPKNSALRADLLTYQIVPISANTRSKVEGLTYSVSQTKLTTFRFDDKQANKSCLVSVQPFATTLTHLHQMDKLIQQFSNEPLAPYVCFSPVKYVSLSTLACNYTVNEKIQCNELQWQNKAKEIDSRYLAIMLPKGGANVHLGLMYIDAEDNVKVFSHELSHFLGFVDEYPLPQNHAKCSTIQQQPFSHNIAVLNTLYQGTLEQARKALLLQIPWASLIKPSTPLFKKTSKGWQLGTPTSFKNEIGVFPAASCNNSKGVQGTIHYQAYKAVYQRTPLMYYEYPLPMKYLSMINTNPDKYLMPSFHYNIALAAFHQGKIKAAKYWLTQAGNWEHLTLRKEKILNGSF